MKVISTFSITLIFLISLSGCDSLFEQSYSAERVSGLYKIEEYSQTYDEEFKYDIEVLPSYTENDAIYIRNFYDSNLEVTAYLQSDKIFIPVQEVNRLEIEGVGTLNGNVIELSYSVFDLNDQDSFPDYCNAVATRVK